MARPANEIVSSARRKAWQTVKPDESVKNARQRARKYGAMQLDLLTKELGVPLRDIVQGYKKQLRILHPYEAVVADLTVRALEKSGHTTLPDVLAKVKAVHKEVTETGKAAAKSTKQAQRASDAAALLEDGTEATCAVVEAAAPLLQEVMAIQKALRQVRW